MGKFKDDKRLPFKDSNEMSEYLKDREEEYAKKIRETINNIFESLDNNVETSEAEIRNDLEQTIVTSEVLYAKYVKKCKRRMKKPIPYDEYEEVYYVNSHYWFETVPDEERKTIPITRDTLEECVKSELAIIERFKSIPKDKRQDYIEETIRKNIEKRSLDFGAFNMGNGGSYFPAVYEMKDEIEKAQAKTFKEKFNAFIKRNYNLIGRGGALSQLTTFTGFAALCTGGFAGALSFISSLLSNYGLSASIMYSLGNLLITSLFCIPATITMFGISSIVYAIKNSIAKKGNVEDIKKYAEALKQLAEKNPAWIPAFEEARDRLQILGSPLEERSL